jgi:hypothetical protein
MTTATTDAAKALPPKDFLVRDYELKVGYLTEQLGRMWMRFNYFLSIETALVGGNLIFGGRKLSPEVEIVGVIVSVIWYVMGAEDRFLVRLYRGHVKEAADLLAEVVWNAAAHGAYRHVGEVAESSKRLDWEFSGWRIECISTTRLAAWIPLLVLLIWLGLLLA